MATTVWKGHLTFGLVSIPVRLYKAARPEKIRFHNLHRVKASAPQPVELPMPSSVPSGRSKQTPPPPPAPATEPELERFERVRQQFVAAPQAESQPAPPVDRSDLVKGFEYAKNRYVVLDQEQDLKPLAIKTSTEMEILEFVRLAEIDPVFFETSYYMAPEEAGEKAYALLFEAMRDTQYIAIAEVAMHRAEHVMIIRPGQCGLITHTMFYLDEIHQEQEYRAETAAVNAKELQLAEQLIRSLAGPFEPAKYKDKVRELLEAKINAKIAGKEVAEAPAPVSKQTAVVDIMNALRNSLSMARKPAEKAQSSRPDEKPKHRRASRT